MKQFAWLSQNLLTPLLTGLLLTGVIVIVKKGGGLESMELAAYDQATRWRPVEKPDPRLLVVGITEQDIAKYKYPLPDAVLNTALQRLIDQQAFIVGFDLVRDGAQGKLLKTLQTADQIVAICNHGSKKTAVFHSPPGVPAEKVGFVDIPIDPDGITRRAALLIGGVDPQAGCPANKSLALQLAETYLANQHNVIPGFDQKSKSYQLGKLAVPMITANAGGYSQADINGYPILLKYRHPQTVAKIVSLTDVLENKITASDIKDRVVLIGSIAGSLKDEFRTPYSAGRAEDNVMPGVLVHAQITSQLMSLALDNRSLMHFWPEWSEYVWLLGGTLVGSYLAWYIRHPGKLAGAIGGAGSTVVGVSGLLFINSVWFPVVTPLLGLLSSALVTAAWRSYQTSQKQQQMLMLTRNQEQTINALKQLLIEKPPTTAPDLTPIITNTNSATTKNNENDTTIPFNLPVDRLLDDRYQIVDTLGRGGFAITYLAEDTKRPSQPHCAIKHLVPARRDPAFVNMARRLFNTEAKILDKLGSHPQIPRLLAYFEQDQEFYLVQEFIPGQSLDEELLQIKEPWPEKKVVELLQQLLPVLAYIHSQHVIHRDVKPSNIIRSAVDQKLVLIDFGAVKEINPQISITTTNISSSSTYAPSEQTIAIGTRGFTPPEQYAGRPNFSSDIYALGMIAIGAASRTNPRDLKADEKTGDLQWQHLASISPELIKIIDRMVACQYLDRYQSAMLALQELQPLIQKYFSTKN
jgi:CHASE2 domain-containing sensor protein/predicted Ser/Thr protein kinase